MTTPARANKRQSKGGPRTYSWPPLPPHEFEVISVTSAVEGGLPKPYLVGWAAKEAAMCAVDDLDIVTKMVERGDEQAAINHIKGAAYRKRDAAGNRGTIVHSAIEAYIGGKPVDVEAVQAQLDEKNVPKSMHKSTFKMIDGVMEFLFDHEPEIFWSEATVYNREHGYAGTADIIGRFKIGNSRLPAILDVKTSKDIYNETAMQLAAYARGEFVGLDDGTEAKLTPRGAKIKHGIVVRPTASGRYQKANFDLTDDVFAKFLACLELADADDVFRQARRP